MLIHSPLEQFEIISYNFNSDKLNNLQSFIYPTNSALYALISFLLIGLVYYSSTYNGTLRPNRWQSIGELTYEFIDGLTKEQLGSHAKNYFPFFFFLFNTVFFCNLVGMIPYSFTVTSHIAITGGLALGVFIGINIIGFSIHGLKLFGLFLPGGSPLALAPLLIGIEFISYTFRVISLAVRLFANMMAGHTLLKILAGFACLTYNMNNFGGIIAAFLVLSIIFAITGLELVIAFLQAYVFTILSCIYLHDAIFLH